MKTNDEIRETQTGKRSAFTIMSNVRDNCKQPPSKKLLVLVIASYCDPDGLCFPGNRLLAKAINKSPRTVKRMLKELAADGELEILTTGGGDQKREICLTRYAAIAPEMPLGGGDTQMSRGGDTQMSRGVVTPLHRQTVHNSHKEQPINNYSSAHAEFVRLWCERFQIVTRERYAFQNGKDGKAVKLLLTTTGLTPEQLIAIAEAAWKRPTGFWCKFATSIAGFNSHFNQIRKETKDGMAIKTSDRDAGRLARARRAQYADVGKLR